MSIKGQDHSLTLAKGHSDFKIETCILFKLVYTVVLMRTRRFISTKRQGHYLTFDPVSNI